MNTLEQYITHPPQIPICLESDSSLIPCQFPTPSTPLSFGGLRCYWQDKIRVGCILRISIPSLDPTFFANVQVIWRKMIDGYYELGLIFLDAQQAYRMRMMEQLCHINRYQQSVIDREGRHLNSDQAAIEWIARYAAAFPSTRNPNT